MRENGEMPGVIMADDGKVEDDQKGKDDSSKEGADSKAEELKALRAEREARKNLEHELKQFKDASEKAEQERLAEQGKHKELFDKANAELKALKAQQEASEFTTSVHKAFTDNEIPTLAETALKMRSAKTAEDMLEVAKNLRAEMDKAVEAKVTAKLETGGRNFKGKDGQTTKQEGMAYPSMQK